MSSNTIDAATLKRIFLSGANNLSNNKEYINELNVFPVPDGDTGTNMTLTIMTAATEVKSVKDVNIANLAKAISSGSLRGARGNSGVILSQLFRGFCKDIKDRDELYILDLANAFSRAVDTAYKAVMKPKEGTILTVARGIADKALECADKDMELLPFAEEVLSCGEKVLENTPELLPVLKEAGVVDSGGQGLVEVLRGIVLALKGEDVVISDSLAEKTPKAKPAFREIDFSGSSNDNISTADIKFSYCTEFIIMLDKELSVEEVNQFKEYLLSIGDSLVCVADEELVKVHVHTNHPGLAFERALTYGALINMKIDNMKQEHNERISLADERNKAKLQDEEFKKIKVELAASKNDKESESNKAPEKVKKYGFVAVAVGDGMVDILKDMGMDHIISGGQTMNPSTDDILNAVADVNAENVFVFPNNKNIILAANQAASICKDKKVIIIPSTSIPQSISAMLAYNPEGEIDSNENDMKEALSTVKTGEVTYAVRDTSIDGVEIHNGDIMGIDDGGIKAVGKDINETTLLLIDKMVDEESGLITVYTGNDISEEDSDKLCGLLTEKYNDLEVEFHKGGQPIYYYLVSVE
ncbi:DAK2 domain-containing protein [Eubacterium sp.]|uniref:DAK2 domain-containing protein n=1 Tax=Eubacterium sp. TaxID=142586 RepID=UPI00258A58D6|nr:DAK2 domain-containing protein [Eubacterium sp.]MCR5367623.1 DAK2 domain-containing protein [Eubacterium sp.]